MDPVKFPVQEIQFFNQVCIWALKITFMRDVTKFVCEYV